MQAVLALLTDEPQTVRGLACRIFGVDRPEDLTRAQIETVRHACKRWAERGKVELSSANGLTPERRGHGSNPRYTLVMLAPRVKLPTMKERKEAMREHLETVQYFDESTNDFYDPQTLPEDPEPEDDDGPG